MRRLRDRPRDVLPLPAAAVRVANLALVPVFMVALVQSGWRSVYALVVVAVALGYRWIRDRAGRRANP
ncbi:hypothetical protein C8K30_103347 [Promicromonospora sp. AC04]|uniref:hypothetical protein n=1 Tax=Promicromonospora sp. AC04 TaxID=2135723 RepID=UPI000D36B9B5|nr:hypothetical protein [Promicromonospora sp. AC04]PUB28921.1 hypothetical protein C8K30_103347 [Promicromonospora sp. AC04]